LLYWIESNHNNNTEEDRFLQKQQQQEQISDNNPTVQLIKYSSDDTLLSYILLKFPAPEVKPRSNIISQVVFSRNALKSPKLISQYDKQDIYVACSMSDIYRIYFSTFQLPLQKISNNLSKLSSSPNNPKLAVIMLSGSFNPIHCDHIGVLTKAKNHLESKQYGYHVLAGFLAPSSNGYVVSKLKDEAIPLQYRNLMIQFLTLDSEWMEVLPWGLASSYQTNKLIEMQLQEHFQGTDIKCFELCGADHAAKYSLWNYYTPANYNAGNMICVGRSPHTDLVKEGLKLVICDQFILVEDCAGEVSSTLIRKRIVENQWEELNQSGWISQEILELMQTLKERLYEF